MRRCRGGENEVVQAKDEVERALCERRTKKRKGSMTRHARQCHPRLTSCTRPRRGGQSGYVTLVSAKQRIVTRITGTTILGNKQEKFSKVHEGGRGKVRRLSSSERENIEKAASFKRKKGEKKSRFL